MIGTVISNYRILEELGRGGMGIVYKAEDLKLTRTVALKFLPHGLGAHEPERARFLQEARAAAILNHPNICTIHDIQEVDGQQFIVMEYVDGKTLREIIPVKKLQDAITYAIQIAEALQEAHTHGIVHRDIKAENIMVNSKGQVKVMDFGLAKLKGSLKLTKTSSTVGTLAYMSPEQIQGEEADPRSDIFSFGIVLYELLTAHLPFRGEHEAAMMYSILNEDPESPLTFRPDLNPELAHILDNALEKEPGDRYQAAGDVARELRRFVKHSSKLSHKILEGAQRSAGVPAPGSVSSAPAASDLTENRGVSPSRRRRIGIPGVVIGGLAVVALAVLGYWKLTTPSPEISSAMVFRPLNVPFSMIWYPGLSPDGNWIAFSATDEEGNTEIYYMNASGGEPRQLTHDSLFKYTASISPDGSLIVYSRGMSRQISPARMSIWTISTLGGEPRKIADPGFGGDFTRDGSRILYLTGNPDGSGSVWAVNLDGSNRQRFYTEPPGPPGGRVSFTSSPDGKEVVFIRNFAAAEGTVQEIILRDMQSGDERQLTHDRKNIDEVCWTIGDLILFSSNRRGPTNLWAISTSGGTPSQITKGPGPDIAVRASSNGKRVLYLQQAQFGSIQIGNADGSNPREITPGDQSVQDAKFSPDGSTIAYISAEPDPISPGSSVNLINRNGQNRRRLVQSNLVLTSLKWSPNGRKIAYASRDTILHANIVDLETPGQQIDMGTGAVQQWLDGGAALNIVKDNACWRVPLDRTAPTRISEDSTVVSFSADGTRQLLIDRRGGKAVLSVIDPGSALRALYEGNLLRAVWAPDGQNIFLTKTDGTMWLISPSTGKMREYFWTDRTTVGPADITSDMKTSVSIRNRTQSKLIVIDNFME